MVWLKKDDNFPNHRKVRRLSDAAYRLHDTAMCYASHDESDGRITFADLDEMQHGRRLRKHVAALVDAGLWEPVDDGWEIHDFLHYNPSHAQLEAEREANRKRQARLRAKRRGVEVDDDGNGVTNGVTNGGVTRESRDPVPGRTVPGRTDPTRAVTPGVLRVVGDGGQASIVTDVEGSTETLDAWKPGRNA